MHFFLHIKILSTSLEYFSKPFDANQQIISLFVSLSKTKWNWITELAEKPKQIIEIWDYIFTNMFHILLGVWKIMQRKELTISNVASLLLWNAFMFSPFSSLSFYGSFDCSLVFFVFLLHIILKLTTEIRAESFFLPDCLSLYFILLQFLRFCWRFFETSYEWKLN